MAIKQINKSIARHTASIFKGKPSVHKYYDKEEEISIDILCCEDSPQPGCMSYCTLGANSAGSGFEYEGKEIKVEVVIAGYKRFQHLPNIIATCAFNLIKDGTRIFPGQVHKSVVREYYPKTQLPHILFLVPFLWGERLKSIEIEGEQVSWLYAIPISEAELVFLDQRGVDDLDLAFNREQIDLFDLERMSLLL